MKVRIERKIYNFLNSKYFNLSIIPVLWCLIILTWFKHVDIFDAMNYGILIFGFYMNCFCIMVALNNPTINNGKEEKIYYNQKEINYSELSDDFKEKYSFNDVDSFLKEVRAFKPSKKSK